MSDNSSKIKSIIMDKAPSANSVSMTAALGYNPGDLNPLAEAINTEFGTSITGSQLEPYANVGEVCTFVLGQITA